MANRLNVQNPKVAAMAVTVAVAASARRKACLAKFIRRRRRYRLGPIAKLS